MDISSAVVLAAGEGRRLRPLTKHRPKPMLPAANRPILEYVLDAVVDAGISDIHLVVGYRHERVQNHFGPRYRGCSLTYHHQEKQLGSGHALLQAADAIHHDFLVVNGDQVIHHEMVADVLGAHTVEDVATLAVVESESSSQYGAIRLSEGKVTELVEKPRTDDYRLVNAGIYALASSFFASVEATSRQYGELSLTDTLTDLIESGESVRGIRTGGIWHDATYPWDLLSVTRAVFADPDLIERGISDEGRLSAPFADDDSRHSDRDVGPDVFLSDSATVHEDATVQGPAIIGPDAVIGPQAVIGPNTAIGQNATVGAGSVVQESIIDGDCRLGPNTTVIDCVTGEHVHLGAGTSVPGGSADVRLGRQIYEECELGGVIADRTRVYGGVTIEPGVLIGPNASIHSGTHVSTNVSDGTEVRR